jgi:hypothetical protein
LLLNLIDHLPRDSFLVEAQADDEELAQFLVRRGSTESERRRRLSEWSPELEALAQAVDRLGELAAILIKANGGNPSPVQPFPRPHTAMDRFRARARFERHRSLVERLTRREG